MKVGDEIWLYKNIGRSSDIVKTTIKSISRKYITVECSPKKKFYIENFQQKDGFGTGDFLIRDIKLYEKRQERKTKLDKILKFNWKRLNANDLEQVLNIIGSYKGVR
ncbi:hypothetical protein DP145_01560 [Clostridium tetani]|uniref:beta barrel domain-containing protein n=1 Tax=Clostridium tetani TaxID=1513 RepID=UPI00100B826F|nr:hypothetical protein [Clostridium tetani]RXI46054.1 hypothetical protein DP126_07640 [Clostridium tetani]RXM61446.1 hypothetical protein DP138_04475 [Clostridium tetani]RXM70271.1 hypothetical protein DP145_01560 [Clostridium tetani]